MIRLAVPRMTSALFDEVEGICTSCEATTDPMRWEGLNRQFHATFYRASGLPFHLASLDKAMDRLDRCLRAQLLLTDGYARANTEHRAIAKACARGDANEAEMLPVAHISAAHATLREHLCRIQLPSDRRILPPTGHVSGRNQSETSA